MTTKSLQEKLYLKNEHMDVLGRRIKHKATCGMGGTTVYLKNKSQFNLIITPNTEQVKHKEAKLIGDDVDLELRTYMDTEKVKVLFIYGRSEDRIDDIRHWLARGYHVNVYTTYTSFSIFMQIPSVAKQLCGFRLVVDEYHSLLTKTYLTENVFDFMPLFENIVLTSATVPATECEHFEGFDYEMLTLGEIPQSRVDKIQVTSDQAVINFVEAKAALGEHVVLHTNKKSIMVAFRGRASYILGDKLRAKLEREEQMVITNKFDYTKNIHIISSAAIEGVDFDRDAHMIISGHYSKRVETSAYRTTECDFIQAAGRCRRTQLSTTFIYREERGFRQAAINYMLDEATKEETVGALNLLEFTSNHQYTFVDGTLASIVNATKGVDFYTSIVNLMGKEEVVRDIMNRLPYITQLNKAVQTKVINGHEMDTRDGYQSGLGVNDGLSYIVTLINMECHAQAEFIEQFGSTRSKDQAEVILDAIYVSFGYAYEKFGFLGAAIKGGNLVSRKRYNLSPYQLKLVGRMEKLSKLMLLPEYQPSATFGHSLRGAFNDLFYKREEKKPALRENGLDFQPVTIACHLDKPRIDRQVRPFIDFIFWYHMKLSNKLPIKGQIPQVLAGLKVKYDELSPFEKQSRTEPTKKSVESNVKLYMKEMWLVYRGAEELVTIEIKDRSYAAMITAPKLIRSLNPLIVAEADASKFHPNLAANWLYDRGFPALRAKMDSNDLYSIEGISRDEAKKLMVSIFNDHIRKGLTKDEYTKRFIQIGVEPAGAELFFWEFGLKKSGWYNYATPIEKHLMQEVSGRVQGYKRFRLHDAVHFITGVDLSPISYPVEYKGHEYKLGFEIHN